MLRLSVLELWVLTSPIGYHWQCVCSHCACAVSRDLCIGGKFSPHIWNPWPRFASSLCNFYGATIKTNGVICQNNVWHTLFGPVLKITQLSVHAQNHVSIERCRKSFTTIDLGDHDFPLIVSNFGNLTAFRAILAIFNCTYTETAIYEPPVKILTSPFDSWTPISLWTTIFPRFEDVFCWFFCIG